MGEFDAIKAKTYLFWDNWLLYLGIDLYKAFEDLPLIPKLEIGHLYSPTSKRNSKDLSYFDH